MEATLVPSRTGLSCRGTEGPTRAARKAGVGETHAACAQMSSRATHWAARLCPPEQEEPGMPQPLLFLPQDVYEEGGADSLHPVTAVWGEADNKDITQPSNLTGSCSFLKPKPWEISAYYRYE